MDKHNNIFAAVVLATLIATPVVYADIPTTSYLYEYYRDYCNNSSLNIPTGGTDIASQSYTLAIVDSINSNQTTYASALSADAIVSVEYLPNTLQMLLNTICCPSGYFNAQTGSCAMCGTYEWGTPDVACPTNYQTVQLSNTTITTLPSCPTGSDTYYDEDDGCNGNVGAPENATVPATLCIPPRSETNVYTSTGTGANNRGKFATGGTCTKSGSNITCTETPDFMGEAHCSTSGLYPASNWETAGKYCWCRLTHIKSPNGTLIPVSGHWTFRVNDHDMTWYCGNRCAGGCADYAAEKAGFAYTLFAAPQM